MATVIGAAVLYLGAARLDAHMRAPAPRIRVVVKPNATPDEVNRVWTEVLGGHGGRRGEDNLLPELSSVTATGGEGNSAVLTAKFSKSTSRRQRDSIVRLVGSSPLVARVDVVPPRDESGVREPDADHLESPNHGLQGVFGRAAMLSWIVVAWILFAWPITIVIAILSIALGGLGARRDAAWARSRGVSVSSLVTPRWRFLSPSLLTGAIILWGGVFANSATQPPPTTPWFVYVIIALLLVEAGVAIRLFVSRRTSGPTALAALLPQLWIGLLAGWLAAWATTTGGTMGAL